MANDLAGKSALITGGGGGFGLACAMLLARDGAAVTLMGRDAARLATAAEAIAAKYPDACLSTYAGDASSEENVRAAIDLSRAKGGGLDSIISTVGRGFGGALTDMSADVFMEEIAYNLRPAFVAIREGVPVMRDGGSFVFISSIAATIPFIGSSGYCAAKAALDHLMRCAANELGPRGFRFNCVRPGLTQTPSSPGVFSNEARLKAFTDRIPLGRAGQPEDVAATVRLLIGPESAWTTGQSFAIDGGNELRGAPQPVG